MSETTDPQNKDQLSKEQLIAALEEVHGEVAEYFRSLREKAGRTLVEALRKWNEKSLDKLRLPHPLLGKLTVREMTFFTLYHDRHHLRSVRQRTSHGAAAG